MRKYTVLVKGKLWIEIIVDWRDWTLFRIQFDKYGCLVQIGPVGFDFCKF